MSYYKWNNWKDEDKLEDVTTLHYSDLEYSKDGDLELPRSLCGGDYSGSCAVEFANYLEWQDSFQESLGVDWWVVCGDYGSYGIAVRKDTENQEILDCLAGLEDYPCINEERVSEVECEWSDEAWENWVAWDLERAIDTEFDIELDLDGTDKLFDLFLALMDRSNTYWIYESHQSAHVDLDRLLEVMTYDDLKGLVDVETN